MLAASAPPCCKMAPQRPNLLRVLPTPQPFHDRAPQRLHRAPTHVTPTMATFGPSATFAARTTSAARREDCRGTARAAARRGVARILQLWLCIVRGAAAVVVRDACGRLGSVQVRPVWQGLACSRLQPGGTVEIGNRACRPFPRSSQGSEVTAGAHKSRQVKRNWMGLGWGCLPSGRQAEAQALAAFLQNTLSHGADLV